MDPLLKYMGGKRRLVPALRRHLPPGWQGMHYVEPMCGSAALFFAIGPELTARKVLGDANPVLTQLYRTILLNPNETAGRLEDLAEVYLAADPERQKALYYEARERFNERLSRIKDTSRKLGIEPAADMIFLNRTGYNGLWRVNASGAFNVPWGKYKSPKFPDRDQLAEASRILHDVEFQPRPYERISDQRFEPPCFVYVDPPYLSTTAEGSYYTGSEFSRFHHDHLASWALRLSSNGAHVMLSQGGAVADDPELFYPQDQGWIVDRLELSHSVSCKGGGRGKKPELIIRNYEGTVGDEETHDGASDGAG